MSRPNNLRYVVNMDNIDNYVSHPINFYGDSSTEDHTIQSKESEPVVVENNELYRSVLSSNDEEAKIISVKNFRKKTYIHIRKHFSSTDKKGIRRWIPTKKGVCMTKEEFTILMNNMRAIDHAVKSAVN